MHPARDDAFQQTSNGIGSPSEFNQFLAEFIEQASKASRRGIVSSPHFAVPAIRFDDQIDRTVLQMQSPAIRQPTDLRNACHGCGSPADRNEGIARVSVLSFSEVSGRTWAM
jgi:hypothetical protein